VTPAKLLTSTGRLQERAMSMYVDVQGSAIKTRLAVSFHESAGESGR
jgi:hypothetical protein